MIIFNKKLVGFGDIFPNTQLGRITVLLGAIIGMVLTTLFVVSM